MPFNESHKQTQITKKTKTNLPLHRLYAKLLKFHQNNFNVKSTQDATGNPHILFDRTRQYPAPRSSEASPINQVSETRSTLIEALGAG